MIGRALILTILAMFIVSGLITRRITKSTTDQNDNIVRYYQRLTGRDLAQTGVNMAMRQLVQNPLWRTGYSSVNMFGAKVSVSLKDTLFKGTDAIKITSTGSVPFLSSSYTITSRDTNITTVAYIPKEYIPGFIKGAITTNNNVQTLGTLTVDGRDHDTSGNALSNQGTWGIWTTGTVSVGGSSQVGGTSPRVGDFTPAGWPSDSVVVRMNQVYPGGFPGTPDSVLGGASKGYPPNTLKSIALAGTGGSQYVTDPSFLTYPLRGVTYVELPSGGTWTSADITGWGILVIHNSTKNAMIKTPTGTFKGIMISDDIDKIHATIIGTVVSLTPSPSGGNAIGNGTGSVLYSGASIATALGKIKPLIVNTYSNKVLGWWE